MGDSDQIFDTGGKRFGRSRVQAWDGQGESAEQHVPAKDYAPAQPRAARKRAGQVSTPSPVGGEPARQQMPAQAAQPKKKGQRRGCVIAIIIIAVLMFIGPLLSTGIAFLGVWLEDMGLVHDDDSDYSDADYSYTEYTELSEEDEKLVGDIADETMASIASGEYGDLAFDVAYTLYYDTGVSIEALGYAPSDLADWLLQDCTYELDYVDVDEGSVSATFEVEHRSYDDAVEYPYWDADYSSYAEKVEGLRQIVADALDSDETVTDWISIDLVKAEDGSWTVVPYSAEQAWRRLWDLN